MLARCLKITNAAIAETRMHCGRFARPSVPRIGNQTATMRNAAAEMLPSEM